VLEDGGQNDQPAAQSPLPQNAGAADAEIRTAAGNRLSDVDAGTALADSDVETSVAIETLLKRCILAGKLKLVFPFELHRYLIERRQDAAPRMRCRQDQAGGHAPPF
jgi:hypothetical protein